MSDLVESIFKKREELIASLKRHDELAKANKKFKEEEQTLANYLSQISK